MFEKDLLHLLRHCMSDCGDVCAGNGERWQTSSDDRILRRYVKRSSKYANRKSAVSFA